MVKVKKYLQSTTGPLERLISRGENLDFRLDQPQWEVLEIGDIIEYWEDFSGWDKEPSENSRRVRAEVIEIIKAKTFDELMNKCEKINYNSEEKKAIFENLRKYWTPEKEKEIGVLGFYVRVI